MKLVLPALLVLAALAASAVEATAYPCRDMLECRQAPTSAAGHCHPVDGCLPPTR